MQHIDYKGFAVAKVENQFSRTNVFHISTQYKRYQYRLFEWTCARVDNAYPCFNLYYCVELSLKNSCKKRGCCPAFFLGMYARHEWQFTPQTLSKSG